MRFQCLLKSQRENFKPCVAPLFGLKQVELFVTWLLENRVLPMCREHESCDCLREKVE